MLNGLTYNQLATECHANNAKWWYDINTGERLERNKGNLIMLMVSELSEAMEGFRKDLMDDKLPHRKMAEVELVDAVIRVSDFAGGYSIDLDDIGMWCRNLVPTWANVFPNDPGEGLLVIVGELWNAYVATLYDPEAVAEHLVMVLIMIEFLAAKCGYDLDSAYREKTAFNKVRKDHTIEARKAAGGKKW